MSGRPVTLNTLKGGINRLRQKGGASQQVLYDLLNGYVTADNSIESRPGTETHATLPANTKGLCAFDGGLVVFSHAAQTMPAGYSCEVINHPEFPGMEIQEIHFAGPYLGYLYVVAEFADASVYHYWLERRDPWAASTDYVPGDIVEPTVRNGFAYRATRLNAPLLVWQPNVPRTVGNTIEPTVANGFYFEVTATSGSSPKSGTVEPNWPTESGATIFEDTDLTPPEAPVTGNTSTDPTLPPSVDERYAGTLAGTLMNIGNR